MLMSALNALQTLVQLIEQVQGLINYILNNCICNNTYMSDMTANSLSVRV